MKFRFEDYRGDYVMHCKTKDEDLEFRKLMHDNGFVWCDENSYLDMSCWETYKENTCYYFDKGQCDHVEYYNKYGYTILNWSDFKNGNVPRLYELKSQFTKSDLEVGMVVETRNGNKYLVCQEGNMVSECSWNDLDYYDEELTSCMDENLDIMNVYKKTDSINLLETLNVSERHLLWSRNGIKKEFADKELLFLKEFSCGYDWIAKNEDGTVEMYEKEPYRLLSRWRRSPESAYVGLPKSLSFESIAWKDEPIRIDDYVDRVSE